MRRRPAAAASSSSDRLGELLQQDMLAATEQQEVVTELRRTLAAQSRTWRFVFAALGVVLSAALAYFAAWQVATPWTAYRHHAEFRQLLPAAAVSLGELLSAACIAASAAALLRYAPRAANGATSAASACDSSSAGGTSPTGHSNGDNAICKPTPAERQLLSGSLAGAAIMAAFWGISILAAGRGSNALLPRQQLRLVWLPIMPLAYALLAVTIVRSYADTADRLKALEAQMYQFEKA